MKVLLNGGVARRGMKILPERFGDRISLRQITPDEDAETVAANMAWAEFMISIEYGAELPPAPNLKVLQLPVAGLDKVDVNAVPASAAICNVYEHEVAIAEYTFNGMLEWVVGLARRNTEFKTGDWSGTPSMGGQTRGELSGMTIGCLGYGNIGRAIARRALAFDMKVMALTQNPRPLQPEPHFLGGYGDLAKLLEEADFLVICCPLSEQTRGIISKEQLAAMKSSAVVINVARGHIADEDALYAALKDGVIGGAVLDTWYQYPSADNPTIRPSRRPYHELDNVLMTPHISGWSEGQQLRRWAKTGDNIEALLTGGELINVIRPADS
ncbi:MAG: 2-hydroxyacid dehydrogenase [Alphaproteobacteria bacterium]|jgi:phosphoglycerate dehydrogenase-like enzyme|nr:2-hydroxyacid dehydrogenase [Alphaproteobacteria bacterium]MDP6832214.1 2-hydroxyacid dehydrogenase [Alphaproteobacteria bacterium]